MFFKFNEEMRKLYVEDKERHDILAWIIYNTNYQEEYKELKKYQCFISGSVVSKVSGISLTKTKTILKALEKEGYLEYIYKSNSKKSPSIIYAKFINDFNSKNDDVVDFSPVIRPVEYVENTTFEESSKPVEKLVARPVEYVENTTFEESSKPVEKLVARPLSKNNISKNISIKNNIDQIGQNDLDIQKTKKRLWELYPRKEGKQIAFKKMDILLKRYSESELIRCIERYINVSKGTEKKFIQQGKTFFTSGYVDYLDENFEEQLPVTNRPKGCGLPSL